MDSDVRAAFAGLQSSIVGTALLAIASHPSDDHAAAPGMILLLVGIGVTATALY
ncbi:hypothetical protein [Salinarchaeum laminariae]|uniref:hypothetical protein n=1 Tax=Salinarchaeum laminariae TaxID=869888 RepID=UPI0020BEEF6F|nr:hypothetical protein [Salinarchaeum laminariae]